MKIRGVNIHGPSVGIGCILGFGAGSAGAYGLYRLVLLPKLHREFYDKVDDRVEAEAAKLRSHYQGKLNEGIKEALASVVSGERGTDGSTKEADTASPALGRQPERPQAVNYAGIRPTASGQPPPEDPRLEGLEEPDGEQHVDAAGHEDGSQEGYHNVFDEYPAGDNPKIRRVTRAEFGEVPPGYTTELLTWYAGDGILVDEQDDPIRVPELLIGVPKPLFGYLQDDPHVYLVINEETDLCIEVTYKEGSWAEHLGYGDPAKKREAPSKEG